MLQWLGLMNVKHLLFLQTMCFVYKLYPRQLPAYLNFTLVNEILDHETRSKDHVFIERVRKQGTRNSFYFKGLEEFNSLPAEVRNASSRIQFKKQARMKRDS